MTRRTKLARPVKPYRDFPLYAHESGQWAKRIRGKYHYFGPWDDWKAALEKYNRERDFLYAGQSPPTESLTVADLLDEYLGRQQAKLDLGELEESSFAEQMRVTDAIGDFFSLPRALSSITTLDGLRLALAQGKRRKLGPSALRRRLSIARSIFKFGRTLRPPFVIEYGDELKAPPARVTRQAKTDRFYEACEIRALVDKAQDDVKPMILLGLCAAYGPQDLCTLTPASVKGEWIEHPRLKTGIDRRAWLWPELQGRGLVFAGWDRFSIARVFADLCSDASVPNHGHYSLRRTFVTVATTADVAQSVIDKVTGHARHDMASVYRQRIFDQQLRQLGEHVRSWYLGTISIE